MLDVAGGGADLGVSADCFSVIALLILKILEHSDHNKNLIHLIYFIIPIVCINIFPLNTDPNPCPTGHKLLSR